MPTFIDPGEFNTSSTMPPLEMFHDTVIIPGLSKLIGCDALVSTWVARPRKLDTVKKHLSKGALLVEIKRGADLPTSLLNHRTNHLKKQVIRMLATGAQPCQCVLLYTGLHAPSNTGKLMLGTVPTLTHDDRFDGWAKPTWTTTEWDYLHFIRTRTKLMDSGLLRWEGLPCNDAIPLWFSDKLNHLAEYKRQPVKTIQQRQHPFSKEHLRKLSISDGAQGILSLFNDFGIAAANSAMSHCGQRLAHVVEFLTNPANAGKAQLIGKKRVASFRKQFGLVDQWSDYGMFVLPLEGHKRFCPVHKTTYWDETCPLCKQKELS